ncbi:hypothetical protein [Escherichia coli]|uniref:hypothetical protein n=1 Tax=Escherichia coli TaxID=562 RepID=UPI00254A8F13|nr:hypothetical protein [Escherichia coli]
MSNIDKQASQVSRYDLVSGYMQKWPDGEFVYHSDYQALLDELEAKDRRIAELELKLEAAEKRIAELEAREVKLPNPHAHLIWIQAGHAPDDYWDDVAVSHSEKDKCCDGSDRYPVYALWEIKEALSAIGINIAAAGKGEAS